MMDSFYTTESVKKMVKMDISRRLRGGQLDLPTLPHVANQVLGMINRPDVTARDLEKLIGHDQKLSARLIKVANSPVYAGSVKITSIQRAVVTVGLRALQDLIFSIAMSDKVFKSKAFAKPMRNIWEHSLATGHIAKTIAKLKGLDSEYAYLCGLLHDIGKPILLNTLEEMNRAEPERFFLSNDLADEVLREYHEQVGGLVATAWEFPGMLQGAIRHHHEYGEAGDSLVMAHLTNVADAFAYSIDRGGYIADIDVDIFKTESVFKLNITPDEVTKLREILPRQIADFLAGF